MEQFSARGFMWIGRQLQAIKGECLQRSIPIDGDEPIYQMARPVDGGTRKMAMETLEVIERECRNVGLTITADTAKDLRQQVSVDIAWHDFKWLTDQVENLSRLIQREMGKTAFFYIAPDREKFWPKVDGEPLFGEEVPAAFPLAFFDIAQAGICLAIGVATASVFHSMRVLEFGLRAFAGEFGIPFDHRNWEPIIREIESKVREMHIDPARKVIPGCKEKQESFAQAASHLGVLKDAWRNYTMHGRGKYTEAEAEQVFLNVKWTMQKLAKLGFKDALNDKA